MSGSIQSNTARHGPSCALNRSHASRPFLTGTGSYPHPLSNPVSDSSVTGSSSASKTLTERRSEFPLGVRSVPSRALPEPRTFGLPSRDREISPMSSPRVIPHLLSFRAGRKQRSRLGMRPQSVLPVHRQLAVPALPDDRHSQIGRAHV